MSPATSSVKSPEPTSISLPSIVMLSTTTPALAVTAPANVAAPALVKTSALVSNAEEVVVLKVND